jgi:glycerol-3-phosphate dehydrogenase
MTSENLKNKTFDLIIIGGGINGAGIALDAALRGLSVLLVDKDDFGSATTSASTKLIHGGLRYLEYYEFSLVRESLRERELLLKNAPHLVRPLLLKVPIYKENKRNSLTIQAGMILYDLLSFDKSLPNHKLIWKGRKGKLEEIEPGLNQNNLKSMVFYYDCQVNFPERLCLELILSANEAGAYTLNHHEVTKITDENSDQKKVFIKNNLSGEQIQVSGKIVVNAGGPFVDEISSIIDSKIDKKIHGTKGSHIIIKKFDNGPKDALYVEAKQDGRPFFIIPWRDYYLVGTTDIYFDEDLDNIAITIDEINYLLFELNHFFLNENLNHDDILYSYSGIRPLPYEPGKKEGQVTRKHIVFDHGKHDGNENILSVIGGKLTTYRNLAEDCVDLVCEKLEKNNLRSQTKSYPIFGGYGIKNLDHYKETLAEDFGKTYNLPKNTIEYLIDYYGSKFKGVLELISTNSALRETICQNNLDILAQVVYAIKYEKAKTLEDILIRRTGIGTSACLGLDCVEKVAKVAASYFNWKNREKKEAINTYKETVKKYYLPFPIRSEYEK